MHRQSTRNARVEALARRLIRTRLTTFRIGHMPSKLDHYAQRTFDFYERMALAESASEAADSLVAEFARLGFEFLTVWSVPPPGSPVKGILLNTRPLEYVQRYVEHDYVMRDPVVTHIRTARRTFSWSDVRQARRLTREEALIMDEAGEFGVSDGLTIPIFTARGTLGVVSPCGKAPDLSDRARSAATMIAIIGHQTLHRLQHPRATAADACELLTAREREVMQWVAFGKTDAEISAILHISASTVAAHVESAKRKLGTPKRAVAVIMALQRGEISI